jgi:hypothetical protein
VVDQLVAQVVGEVAGDGGGRLGRVEGVLVALEHAVQVAVVRVGEHPARDELDPALHQLRDEALGEHHARSVVGAPAVARGPPGLRRDRPVDLHRDGVERDPDRLDRQGLLGRHRLAQHRAHHQVALEPGDVGVSTAVASTPCGSRRAW